jgi:hypothetical protein
MALLDTLLTEPFGKDVGHGSRRESDGEWEFAIVSSHGGNVQVLGNLDLHGPIGHTENGSDFSHSVGSVVEHE